VIGTALNATGEFASLFQPGGVDVAFHACSYDIIIDTNLKPWLIEVR